MISSYRSQETETHKQNSHLLKLGWSSFFEGQLTNSEPETSPARVIGVRKNSFLVSDGKKQQLVTMAGSLINDREVPYPAVGDWVLLRDTVICQVLERQNILVRKVSGRRDRKTPEPSDQEQVIAVNLEAVFIVCGLDRDFNLRRLERYLTMVYNCGLTPEIILTKADLHQNPHSYVIEVETVAFGVPIHLVSAEDEMAITQLQTTCSEGTTTAIVGSSGAGKSTLINRLYGEEIRTTGAVGDRVGKGKHTTTTRDLILLPSGGMLIDNPGIREIALHGGSEEAATAFPEIEEYAKGCKFQDCSHTHEPGCQVLHAVSSGKLARERLQSYHKIKSELTYVTERQRKSSERIEKERWKGVSQLQKEIKKRKSRR